MAGLNLRGNLYYFSRKKCQEYPLKLFDTNVVRGNAVQILLNFPAKRLSNIQEEKLFTPFNGFLLNKFITQQVSGAFTYIIY